MNNTLTFPLNDFLGLIESKELVEQCKKNEKISKEHYVKARYIRSQNRYRDYVTGEIVRTKGYLDAIRLRIRIKKTIYLVLLSKAETITSFILSSIRVIKNNIGINKTTMYYLKKLLVCLMKKVLFIINKCSKYNDKRLYKIKTSKKTTLKHGLSVYEYKDRINNLNEILNELSYYFGSIKNIKISNRKDYVKEIYDNLVKVL